MREILEENLIGELGSLDAAYWTIDRERHLPIHRFDVKFIFLTAMTNDF